MTSAKPINTLQSLCNLLSRFPTKKLLDSKNRSILTKSLVWGYPSWYISRRISWSAQVHPSVTNDHLLRGLHKSCSGWSSKYMQHIDLMDPTEHCAFHGNFTTKQSIMGKLDFTIFEIKIRSGRSPTLQQALCFIANSPVFIYWIGTLCLNDFNDIVQLLWQTRLKATYVVVGYR